MYWTIVDVLVTHLTLQSNWYYNVLSIYSSYTEDNTKNRAWYSHIQYLQAQLIPHYIELKPESALLYKWFNVAKKYAKVYLLRTERVVLAEVLVMSVGSSATHWMMPLSSAVRLCKVSLLVARDNAPLSSVISTLPWLWLKICSLCIHDIWSTVTLTAAAVHVNVVLCVSPSATAATLGSGGVSIRGISVQEWRHAEECRWAPLYTTECESTGLQSAANSHAGSHPILSCNDEKLGVGHGIKAKFNPKCKDATSK